MGSSSRWNGICNRECVVECNDPSPLCNRWKLLGGTSLLLGLTSYAWWGSRTLLAWQLDNRLMELATGALAVLFLSLVAPKMEHFLVSASFRPPPLLFYGSDHQSPNLFSRPGLGATLPVFLPWFGPMVLGEKNKIAREDANFLYIVVQAETRKGSRTSPFCSPLVA